MRDSAGDALTLVDGRVGAGVSAVTITLSDGSTVQATVSGGWYLAWWPGSVAAANAQISTASGTGTVAVPAMPTAPSCPAGAHCSSAFGFGGGRSGHVGGQSTTSIQGASGTASQ